MATPTGPTTNTAATAATRPAAARCWNRSAGSRGALRPLSAAGISTTRPTAKLIQPSQPIHTSACRNSEPSSGSVSALLTSSQLGMESGSGLPATASSASGMPTRTARITTSAPRPRRTEPIVRRERVLR
ncbi:hypothetical protein C1I92_15375 [Jiangella anatolica]|uniref:Uncharacterized protein n=1 Tax=Jiangella anatolica TaxID=2670374 RepID=A0A2W2C3H3_9ACTN|nr:hypothetical protein C1I92_15375 [Jiangella anatolica]